MSEGFADQLHINFNESEEIDGIPNLLQKYPRARSLESEKTRDCKEDVCQNSLGNQFCMPDRKAQALQRLPEVLG